MNLQDEALSVTQADRNAADNLAVEWPKLSRGISRIGLERAFARHRLSHSTPAGRAQGEVAGYLVDGEWTDAEAFKRIKYPEAHRVVTLYAAPPAQDQGEGR